VLIWNDLFIFADDWHANGYRWRQGRSKASVTLWQWQYHKKNTSEPSFKFNTDPARPWLRPDHGVQDQHQA